MTGRQTFHRVIAPSRRDHDHERITVTTVLVFMDFRRVSISPELQWFLLSMCIDAPESTTNSRSSGFFEEGASITHASLGEQNVAFSLFLSI